MIRDVRRREWGVIDGVCVATVDLCQLRQSVSVSVSTESSAFCQQLLKVRCCCKIRILLSIIFIQRQCMLYIMRTYSEMH